MFKKLLLSSIAVSLIFVSCSNPKEASKNNFMKALATHYDHYPPNASSYGLHIPAVINKSGFSIPSIKTYYALNKVGLVSAKDTITSKGSAVVFALTDSGNKYYCKQTIVSVLGRNTFEGFRIAKVRVSEISNYTEPTEMMGKKVSQITYKKELHTIASWAKDPDIQKSFFDLRQYFDPEYSSKNNKIGMILTANGWVSEMVYQE